MDDGMEYLFKIENDEQKQNDINLDFNTIQKNIKDMIQKKNIPDLGEKKINCFGLFDFRLDFLSNSIETQAISTIVDMLLKFLENLKITYGEFRFKLYISKIDDNNYYEFNDPEKNIEKLKKRKEILQKIYDNNDITKIIFFGKKYDLTNVDSKLFTYVNLIIFAILEDSKTYFLGHELTLEII